MDYDKLARAIYEELGRLPQQGKATMVGYLLRNTVSAHGTVSRGVRQHRQRQRIWFAPSGI